MPASIDTPLYDHIIPVGEFILAQSPALAAGMILQTGAAAIGLAALNAANAQQQLNILAQAVTAMCATELLAGEEIDSTPARTA